MGVELMPGGEEAWVLPPERALHGNLRWYIEENENEPPSMA